LGYSWYKHVVLINGNEFGISLLIKEGQKILEIGIDGDNIIDFQSGNISQQEIMELYNNES